MGNNVCEVYITMMKTIPAPFTKGVNFSNWLEHRPAEQINADMFTREDFVNVKKLGCDVIRLPTHFERFCFAENAYRIPEKILTILDNVAAWAEDVGLYVILDFHNNCAGDSITPDNIEATLTPVWNQLANRYKDATERLVFEIMNEPHGISIEKWNGIILRIFKMIREIDPKRWIIVGGADWNSTAAMKQLPDFRDDKVIYTFHYYDPFAFTHQGAVWTNARRLQGIPFPYDPARMPELPENPTADEIMHYRNYPVNGTLEAVVSCFDQYVDFSRERNAPVFCGEFGCLWTVPNEERVNWYKLVVALLAERGIARTSWDYYASFGVFNKTPRGVRPQFPQDLNRPLLAALGLNADVE
jgi:endoglucanase